MFTPQNLYIDSRFFILGKNTFFEDSIIVCKLNHSIDERVKAF